MVRLVPHPPLMNIGSVLLILHLENIHLSSPHSDPDNVSIKELIDKESCRLSKSKLMMPFNGRNASLCKVDI